MNQKKPGRRYEYPENFIKWTALVYHTMNLPYRTLQGFLQELSKYIPKLKAAEYTTLFRRIRDADINIVHTIPPMSGDIVIAVDTTGIKITSRGEWMRRKWRIQKDHRGWIKVHMAVDTRRKEILAINITDEKTGDDTGFKDLLDQCRENISDAKIKKVLGDGAYNRRSIFNYLRRHGIKSGIKMRKNAKTNSNKSPYRISCVKRRNEIGYNGWKKEVG